MNFVKIKREKKNPPSDEAIRTAMGESGGAVHHIEEDGGKKVTYTGDVNHTVFQNKLEKAAGGDKQSWDLVWGDTAKLPSDAVAGTSGTAYGVTIHNASQLDNAQAIVFQQAPLVPADVVSLAWLAKTCHKNTQVTFNWTLDFNFVWGQNGQLEPGVNYQAGGVIPADLNDTNDVTLSYIDGGFEFGPTSAGPQVGSLYIIENDSVPGAGNPDQGSVGIGMYGAGTFVAPTQPTGSSGGLQFQIRPQYWVAFGNHQAGEVIDESALYYPIQVQFSGSSFNADCVFNGTGWEITYS